MSKFTINKEGLKILKGSYGQLYFGKIYRFMKMDGILPSLENSALRYSDPVKFNDPLDCSFRTINLQNYFEGFIDRNKEKLAVEITLLFLKKGKSHCKDPKIFDSLIEAVSSPNFIKEVGLDQSINNLTEPVKYILLENAEEFIKTMNSDVKVCCFSRAYDSPKSFLMWSHYADSHYGACLEFDLDKKLMDFADKYEDLLIDRKDITNIDFNRNSIPFIVKYAKKIPKTTLKGSNSDYRWMTTKSQIWSYEKEVRCFIQSSDKPDNDESHFENVSFPFKYLTKVIFGCLTPKEDIEKVKNIVNKKYSDNNIRFEKMEVDPATFNLVAKDIT